MTTSDEPPGGEPFDEDEPFDDDELLDEDMSHLPRELRFRRARTFLEQMIEDDWSSAETVLEAAEAVEGRDAPWHVVLATVEDLYLSFLDDPGYAVIDWDFTFHYVDAQLLRADLAQMWRRGAEGVVPFGGTPWLSLEVHNHAPPDPR